MSFDSKFHQHITNKRSLKQIKINLAIFKIQHPKQNDSKCKRIKSSPLKNLDDGNNSLKKYNIKNFVIIKESRKF